MITSARTVPLANGNTRFVVLVRDDVDPDRRDVRRGAFLQTLTDNEAAILRPGGAPWEKLSVWHDGTRWVAEADAEVREARR